ncbi:MAG: 3-mercaptopyruvate sulfurtransferase [Ponticaulis sp.]|mgnify:FL=1|nr:3-mercaptopyruvate sulfurtransferase [Ponticaulis sp.]
MTDNDPLVTAEWLKSHIDAPDIRVVDATWIPPWSPDASPSAAKRLYMDGHIPGAVFFDIDQIAETDSPYPHMMPGPEKFSSNARKLGLGDGKTIIVYDRGDFIASARVWWMIRHMGHRDVKVLDGGWSAWLRIDGKVEDLEPVVSERHHTVRVQNQLIKSYDQMLQNLETTEFKVLDARSTGRFDGTEAEPRAGLSSGHIPNSSNVPASSLVDQDGKLKSKSDLQDLLGEFTGEANLVASCGSGVSAAVILLALFRLGRDDVALYDGSWTEWASKDSSTIAKA